MPERRGTIRSPPDVERADVRGGLGEPGGARSGGAGVGAGGDEVRVDEAADGGGVAGVVGLLLDNILQR